MVEKEQAAETPEPEAKPALAAAGPSGIEVDLAALAAARSVAHAIASRCQKELERLEATDLGETKPRIVLVAASAAAAAASVQLLQAELAALEKALGAIGTGEDSSLESLKLEWPTFDEGLGKTVELVRDTLLKLGVDESFDRRATMIDEPALHTMLAGALIDANFEVQVIDADSSAVPPRFEAAERVIGQIARVRGLEGADDPGRKALLDQAEASITRIRDKAAETSLGLRLVEALDARRKPLLLTARSFAAGGAYRTRKHLFTLLGLVRGLSFSGGAAILFRLSDPKGRLLVADLLYHAGRPGRIPRWYEKLLSNL
ncbi:MAG TPA: hypothetical protein VF718_09840 [Allosphingosinicella sp.]